MHVILIARVRSASALMWREVDARMRACQEQASGFTSSTTNASELRYWRSRTGTVEWSNLCSGSSTLIPTNSERTAGNSGPQITAKPERRGHVLPQGAGAAGAPSRARRGPLSQARQGPRALSSLAPRRPGRPEDCPSPAAQDRLRTLPAIYRLSWSSSSNASVQILGTPLARSGARSFAGASPRVVDVRRERARRHRPRPCHR